MGVQWLPFFEIKKKIPVYSPRGPYMSNENNKHLRFGGATVVRFFRSEMSKTFGAVFLSLLVFAGALFGQTWSDWSGATKNADIKYRSQVFDNAKACYLEFRDEQQGRGNTTFDVDVDFKSTDLNANEEPIQKTDTEHIVTTPGRVGTSRISNCSAVTGARASLVQRH